MSRQMKLGMKTGQPPPRWAAFMNRAARRIVERGGFKVDLDPLVQLALEIVHGGEGEAFLKAARRGRSTRQQNIRYQLLRVVEAEIGASVPRRREDRNTPEAQPPFKVLRLDHTYIAKAE